MAQILIVDDEAAIRKLMAQILKSEGHDCELAVDASEARRRLAQHPFDLIMCDINMPGESGIDFIRYALQQYPDTGAIMVTAIDDTSIARAIIDSGAFDYITKPIERNRVAISLANAMRRLKLEQTVRVHHDTLEKMVVERTGELLQANKELETAKWRLTNSERNYRMLIENIPGVVYRGLPDWRIAFLSSNIDNLIGYGAQELIDAEVRWIDIILPEDRPALKQTMIDALKTDGTFNRQYRIRAKDGEVRWVQDHGCVLTNSRGQIEEVSGVVFDLTHQKMLEMKLAHAQKLEAIGQLAAGIAHEINTPTQYVGDNTRFLKDAFDGLLHIASVATTLKSNGSDPDQVVNVLQPAIEAADLDFIKDEVPLAIRQTLEGVTRITEIVRSMKDFSHPGSKDKSDFNINRALKSTAILARNEWKYVADLNFNLDPDLPLVPGLSGELNQVFLNMIVNAAHAIEEVQRDGHTNKGRIDISTRSADQGVEIRISDSGCGMTPEVRDRIFEPFYTTKTVGKGTGQGLALSHEVIVEKHQGAIDVESEPGKGTTFVLQLPRESA